MGTSMKLRAAESTVTLNALIECDCNLCKNVSGTGKEWNRMP